MITKIHINQHKIKYNKKNNTNFPVITCKDWKQNRKGNTVSIFDGSGTLIAQILYRPKQPLNCGAACWVQTTFPVKVEK